VNFNSNLQNFQEALSRLKLFYEMVLCFSIGKVVRL
jgi:hypothetical protein